jgi:acyl carrier protein
MDNKTAIMDIDAFKDYLINELYVDIPKEEIKTDMSIANELGVDSIGFTEIVAFLEDKYGISIFKDEFKPDNFRTINSISSFIEKKLSNA